MLFDELSELCGQRNAIDGRIVDIVAELERDELCGMTGARSVAALVAWKTGVTPRNAETVVAVARRVEEFPRCTQDLREGRLSLDQVGVIAERAADGSDAHYAELAAVATVTQLRTAIKLEPRPEPDPKPEPQREITKIPGPADEYTTWRIRLPRLEAAKFEAALQSHHDALVADWKRDHDIDPNTGEPTSAQAPPFPNSVDAFMSLIQAGWDTDVAARPHGQRTTVAVHLNLTDRIAALHLGPVLTDEERRFLLCDATCEVWFESHGHPIGAGRTTRTISRRLRRALEHRDRCCVVPGCGATRGLHAHHIIHWEDGGPTDLDKLKYR
ncbi:HNH endonuclease domain-containing protein [Mycolicibacterium conceptionense]|uniref:HNH endonuclease domain-containing protein n=1 Tax=Mycolicibacterium conceptionense TaxID=451644 RepID=A0A0U1CZ95_9MYCO|nr:HNH endonuclease domain-containing protein [Mycolicibacterium conceptionense]